MNSGFDKISPLLCKFQIPCFFVELGHLSSDLRKIQPHYLDLDAMAQVNSIVLEIGPCHRRRISNTPLSSNLTLFSQHFHNNFFQAKHQPSPNLKLLQPLKFVNY